MILSDLAFSLLFCAPMLGAQNPGEKVALFQDQPYCHAYRGEYMKRIIGYCAAIAFWATAAIPGSAHADPRMDAIMQFCKTDTAIPSQTVGWFDQAPDGNIRGPRPAALLYAEALKAIKAGGHDNELQAVRWILLCEAHDQGSWQHIANNNQMVIDYLRAHP